MKSNQQSKTATGTSGVPCYHKHGGGDSYSQYSTKRDGGKKSKK